MALITASPRRAGGDIPRAEAIGSRRKICACGQLIRFEDACRRLSPARIHAGRKRPVKRAPIVEAEI